MVFFLASSPRLISGGREDHPGMFVLSKLGLLLLFWFDLNDCVTGDCSCYLLSAQCLEGTSGRAVISTPHTGD